MAKLPRFSLSYNDKNKKWELKREGSGEVVKRFKTKANATKGGVFRIIIKITARGTRNSQGVMWKAASMEVRMPAVSALPEVSMENPIIIKTTRVIKMVGMVV